MRTLVTGGAGFIGSHVVDALLERGDDVTVLDDVSTGRRENLESALGNGAKLVDGDIRDAGAVAELCERVRPEVIFHLAAQIDVRKSVTDPALDARVNVEGTVNVLRAAQTSGVPRVRPTIFGDGRQTRDYVYVGDVATANLLAAESDAGGPFNIGLGEEVDVLELVEALRPHAANGFDPEHAPERPGEVHRIALDCSRAREELGWEAKVGLEEGLERTLASLR
jgi:nucleoside-diphosphate-sugar epimerase